MNQLSVTGSGPLPLGSQSRQSRRGASPFPSLRSELRAWIRGEVAKNVPYDQFVRKIVAADGSNKDVPAASYFKILRDPASITENTTHLFLGVRFNCTKCHDHPFEKWTQDQYYETAAFFARTALKADPQSQGRNIGGTAVEGAKPIYHELPGWRKPRRCHPGR